MRNLIFGILAWFILSHLMRDTPFKGMDTKHLCEEAVNGRFPRFLVTQNIRFLHMTRGCNAITCIPSLHII